MNKSLLVSKLQKTSQFCGSSEIEILSKIDHTSIYFDYFMNEFIQYEKAKKTLGESLKFKLCLSDPDINIFLQSN